MQDKTSCRVFYEANTRNLYACNSDIIDFIEQESLKIWEMFYDTLYSAKEANMPYIFISSRVKRISNGKYTTKYIVNEITDIINELSLNNLSCLLLDKLKSILKRLDAVLIDEKAKFDSTENRILVISEIYELEQLLKEECLPCEKEIFDRIKELISNWKNKSDLKLGEYFKDRNQIVIYEEAIRKSTMHGNVGFYGMLEMVLAHELFHAYHYGQNEDSLLWKGGRAGGLDKGQKNIVKESLADYMAVYWCYKCAQYDIDEYLPVAMQRVRLWASRYYSWPYARAIDYLKDSRFSNSILPIDIDLIQYECGLHNVYNVFVES